MCGRFTLFASDADILAAFDIDSLPVGVSLVPRYNIAPSQDIAIVRSDDTGHHLGLARWGLVPGWSKEAKTRYATINARMESVADKPAYRAPFRRKRCLVPADGFYEWQQTADGKIPHYICRQDRQVFAFAGLWDHWSDEAESFDSCVIITAPASGLMADLHSRMPVILAPAAYATWLDPALTAPGEIAACLASSPAAELTAWPVSTRVNSPKHDEPHCLEPA
ncbi:MAG: SOS response-associated peptidase [Gammaproteobacteria bacterium]